jgi:hypothetical protein
LDALSFQLGNLGCEVRQNYCVKSATLHPAAAKFRILGSQLRLGSKSSQAPATTLDFLQTFPHRWQKCIRFFKSK